MDRRLVDVSHAGNIEAFFALLEDDPTILNFIDQVPFTRTPLHIAILAQRTQFAKEVARLKPSFITKIDSFGYSPLHLVAENGHLDTLRFMLDMLQSLPEVQFLQGKEKRTPLHVAVISGKIEAVNLLLDFCPGWILDLTARHESALHLAVKNRQLGVLVGLVEWLKLLGQVRAEQWKMPFIRVVHASLIDDRKMTNIDLGVINCLFNLKDEQGNNIMHLATMSKQWQVIEALLSAFNNSRTGIQIDVNALNGKNLTTLDLFLQSPKEKRDPKIEQILRRAGAKTTTQMIFTPPSPALRKEEPTKNLELGLEITFAIFMVATCLLTATKVIDFCPLLVFNMVGFLLSFSVLVGASSMGSPLWKLPLFALLLAYIYLVFSMIPSTKDQLFFGAIFLTVGAAISMVYAKMKWGFHKKQWVEVEVPLFYGDAEP